VINDMKVFDADGHLLEAFDIYERFIGPEYRQRVLGISGSDSVMAIYKVDGVPMMASRPTPAPGAPTASTRSGPCRTWSGSSARLLTLFERQQPPGSRARPRVPPVGGPSCEHSLGVQLSLLTMVVNGAFDRFPRLWTAYLEAGCAWAP
jgi:hypothetical protein